MSKLAQDVQAAVDQLGVEPEQGETMAMTRDEKLEKKRKAEKVRRDAKKGAGVAPKAAKVKVKPKQKAVKQGPVEKEKNVRAGLHAKPKAKLLVINRDGALAVTLKALTAFVSDGTLSTDEKFEADRMVARLQARIG